MKFRNFFPIVKFALVRTKRHYVIMWWWSGVMVACWFRSTKLTYVGPG